MARTIDITRASPTDIDTLGATMGGAFLDDPVMAWVIPDPAVRAQRLPAFFRLFAEVYVPLGESYIAADGAGGAMWAPPGTAAVNDENGEAFGARLAEVLGDAAERGFEVDALLTEHHPEAPCMYLQWLGVTPEYQGRGLGSRFLSMVLERCDSQGVPAYLEATSPDNLRLYERHGFDAMRELTLPGGPSLWPMWREPASGEPS